MTPYSCRNLKLFLKDVIWTLFKAEVFTVAAKLKALPHTPSEVGEHS